MKTQIKLYRNNWITGNSVYVIGWASKGNTCYSGKEFHQLISSLTVKKNIQYRKCLPTGEIFERQLRPDH